MSESSSPLTPTQRRQAIAWVSEHDSTIAEALATELELDPAMRILLRSTDQIRDQMEGMRKDLVDEVRAMRKEAQAEQRTTRWLMTVVQLFAMATLAGMVGLSASLGGGGLPSIEVTPAGVDMVEPAVLERKEAPGNDDAAMLDDDTGPLYGPRPQP